MSESKRKPGRPRRLTDMDMHVARSVAPDVTSDRGKHNVHYRQRAVSMLCRDPRFSFIADSEKMMAGSGREGFKPTILAELGRIEDRELMEAVALEVCGRQMKAKDAVPYIRRVRLGREAKPSCLTLAVAIEAAINRYLALRPSTPTAFIANTLADMAECLRDEE